jgi:alpha/beta hydrolase family protein DUF900
MYFVNFHYSAVSIHARTPPQILSGNGDQADPALAEVQLAELAGKARGKHVFFITHGFNVSYAEGVRSLARFAARLAMPDGIMVVGVLWPGDFYIPAVNYPAASVPAMESGQSLGDICNSTFGGALSLSFFSHSLGARVVLEAVKRLKSRKAHMLCISAGAVNDDCLTGEYATVAGNATTLYNLASAKDTVLQIAFPVGDLIGQLFVHDHGAFQEALGRHGPNPAAPSPTDPHQIPDVQGYNHGNYLASSAPVPAAPAKPDDPLDNTLKWHRVCDFVGQAYNAALQPWPGPLQ